jgi:hypothetical protein
VGVNQTAAARQRRLEHGFRGGPAGRRDEDPAADDYRYP